MSTKWNLTGTYFETCNCAVACPCVFLSPPTTGECTALVAWHIDRGGFDDVGLNGLNVALAVHVPGHMLQVKWKAALYLDERAMPAQHDALLKIFSGQAGGHLANLAAFIGELMGVSSAAIEYGAEGKRRWLRIGNVADAEVEALSGQGGAEVTLHHLPFCIAPGQPVVVAKSKRLSFHDHGLQWEITDRNGFYSPFVYQTA